MSSDTENDTSGKRRHILVDAVINICYFLGYILALHVIGLWVLCRAVLQLC